MNTPWKAACACMLGLFLLAPGLGRLTARADPAGDGNGTIGQLSGEGGDPVLGARLYEQRCAACHDHPTGRTPPKAGIADNTRVYMFDPAL